MNGPSSDRPVVVSVVTTTATCLRCGAVSQTEFATSGGAFVSTNPVTPVTTVQRIRYRLRAALGNGFWVRGRD